MKLPYTKSRCWQSWLSGFPFLHMCSLLCYRWPVKSPQIPTTLIKVNITPDWWGIVSWCFLFLMVLSTLLKTHYKENVFGDESELLVALLIDRRMSEFWEDSFLLPSLVIGWFPLTVYLRKYFTSDMGDHCRMTVLGPVGWCWGVIHVFRVPKSQKTRLLLNCEGCVNSPYDLEWPGFHGS